MQERLNYISHFSFLCQFNLPTSFHEAESLLKSYEFVSHSRISPYLMELRGFISFGSICTKKYITVLITVSYISYFSTFQLKSHFPRSSQIHLQVVPKVNILLTALYRHYQLRVKCVLMANLHVIIKSKFNSIIQTVIK